VEEGIRRIEDAIMVVEQPTADGEIARLAARQIEFVRSEELERRRVEEERLHKERGRRDLLEYWAKEFLERVRTRAEAVNSKLGEEALEVSEVGFSPTSRTSYDDRRCEVRFLHAKLTISLEALPLEGPDDMLAWGAIELRTNKRLWLGNVYLASQPIPYGTWYEVEMHMSALVRGDSTLGMDDRGGGRYKVEGNKRLVLAENWIALAFQREMKNTTSLVDYSEKPLILDTVLDECIRVMVEDGTVPPSDPHGLRGTIRTPWTLEQ